MPKGSFDKIVWAEQHISVNVRHRPLYTSLVIYSLVKDILLYDKGEWKATVMDSSPSTRQKFDAFKFWLSENDCGEDEKNAIVDSFNFDDFTADELLTEVRMSGLYSVSKVTSKALEIFHKKDQLICNQEQEIISNQTLLSGKDREIEELRGSLKAKEEKINQYVGRYGQLYGYGYW